MMAMQWMHSIIVWTELIARIKGDPWILSEQVINELRNGNMPNLLR